jgi:hypothetical protein
VSLNHTVFEAAADVAARNRHGSAPQPDAGGKQSLATAARTQRRSYRAVFESRSGRADPAACKQLSETERNCPQLGPADEASRRMQSHLGISAKDAGRAHAFLLDRRPRFKRVPAPAVDHSGSPYERRVAAAAPFRPVTHGIPLHIGGEVDPASFGRGGGDGGGGGEKGKGKGKGKAGGGQLRAKPLKREYAKPWAEGGSGGGGGCGSSEGYQDVMKAMEKRASKEQPPPQKKRGA